MRAVLDRFEEDSAILLFGDGELLVELPRKLLPPGAVEGDILTVSFEIDRRATAEQRRKIAGLLERLKEER